MANYDWDETCRLIAALEEYCTFEENEHGEAVRYLLGLAQYPDYISQDLWDAVVAGMKEELENYEKHCRIVKTKETYEREYVELEWD
jgi:hypothetical protein